MPNYLLVNGGLLYGNQPCALTEYAHVIGAMMLGSVEDAFQLIARDSYTLSNLFVCVSTNTLNGNTTVRNRVGAANGNQSVSIAAGATGAFTDSSNTDSLVDDNLFCTQTVTGGTSGEITFAAFSYVLSTVNTTPILAAAFDRTLSANSVYYLAIGGSLSGSNTESAAYYKFRVSAILSNLRTYIRTNSVTATSTLLTRINAGNGSQSVSIPDSTTGAFEDISNSDSVVSGDNVNYRLTTGATGTSLRMYSIQVKSISEGRQIVAASPSPSSYPSWDGGIMYTGIEGDGTRFTPTESWAQVSARASFIAKNMYVNISYNALDGATSIRIRKNGGNGNMVVSVGAAATGQFEDLGSGDNFVAADLLNWSELTSGTSGSIGIACIGFELAQAAAPKGGSMAAKLVAAGMI